MSRDCIKHVRKTNTVNSDCIKRRLPQSQFKPASHGVRQAEARAALRTYVQVNTVFRTYFRGKKFTVLEVDYAQVRSEGF